MNKKVQSIIILILLVFAIWVIGSYIEVMAHDSNTEYGQNNFFTTIFSED